MRTILPASLAAAVAIVTACSGVREKSFEKDVEAYREEVGNVGLAVAVVKDGEIVYHKQFGVKNLQTQEPIAEDDLFRIASISKSFSATSIMQLKEKGLVTLDTDVSSLAGFPIRNPRYPEKVITLEMLLSHTSSLNDSEGYFTLDAINPATNPDWANCYNEYAPGEGYEYCNLNFNLVGSFIEKLSGERFDQYVVNHILRPLGIEGGYCVDSLDARKFVSLYNYRDGQYVEEPEAYEPRSERIAAYRFGYDTPVFSPTRHYTPCRPHRRHILHRPRLPDSGSPRCIRPMCSYRCLHRIRYLWFCHKWDAADIRYMGVNGTTLPVVAAVYGTFKHFVCGGVIYKQSLVAAVVHVRVVGVARLEVRGTVTAAEYAAYLDCGALRNVNHSTSGHTLYVAGTVCRAYLALHQIHYSRCIVLVKVIQC